MGKLMRSLLFFLGGVIAIWCLLFGFFLIDALSFKGITQEQCDNVIVLTGGKNRIQHALRSIKTNRSKNIFISGVYAKTTLNDILGEDENKEGVNFILGKKARNTFENADEIDNWVRINGIKKIMLITSDYHMRRSILALNHKNKTVKIIPCVSKSKFDFYFFKICVKEFHKTIYVCLKFLFDDFSKAKLC